MGGPQGDVSQARDPSWWSHQSNKSLAKSLQGLAKVLEEEAPLIWGANFHIWEHTRPNAVLVLREASARLERIEADKKPA